MFFINLYHFRTTKRVEGAESESVEELLILQI
jgi:hypothetical protein